MVANENYDGVKRIPVSVSESKEKEEMELEMKDDDTTETPEEKNFIESIGMTWHVRRKTPQRLWL